MAGLDRWELAHWAAKLRLDPSPTEAMTHLAAMLAMVTANSAFGSRGKATSRDFLIDWRAEPPPPEVRQELEADAWIRWVALAAAAEKARTR